MNSQILMRKKLNLKDITFDIKSMLFQSKRF